MPLVFLLRCFPILGIIDRIGFGEAVVTDAYVVTPAMYAPGLMLGVSTYNNVLTLMLNYYVSEIKEDDINELLNRILNDIQRCICF